MVSIAPETVAQTLPEYQATTALPIRDFSYKSQTLEINFTDGTNYEYFDVPKNTYQKMVNADSPGRFARRHVYHTFVYRKMAKSVTE